MGFKLLSHNSCILLCNVRCIKYMLDYSKFLLAYIGENILVMNDEVRFPGHTTFVPGKTIAHQHHLFMIYLKEQL